MKKKNILFSILVALGFLASPMVGIAQSNSQSSFSPFAIFNTTITPKSDTWNLKIPALSSSGTPCLTAGSTGLFATTTCGSGGGTSTPSIGSAGWVQFASSTTGFFDATSTLSYSTTTNTFTIGGDTVISGSNHLYTHGIQANDSAGIHLHSNNGTEIGYLGAGGGANVTWAGNHNFTNQTADTIASFGASKTLTSLSTSTYPSLTELSYMKGVTSAIQTQLNAKQATLVSGTNIKTINSTSLLGSGDISISASPAGSSGELQFNNGGSFGASSKFTVNSSTGKLRISGVQSPTIELYTSLGGSLDRNWSITTTQGVNGNFVINKSTSAGGDPANNPVFGLDQYGSLQIGTNSSLTYPSPLPAESKSINIKSSSSAYGTGIFARRGGDEATGFNIWEYGGNFYIDSYYNDDGSNFYFRTKAAGTPVTAMTIKGTADIGIGVTSPSAKLHIVKTTEQLRVGYDASNYYKTTVGSTGGVTFDAVGSGAGYSFTDSKFAVGTTTSAINLDIFSTGTTTLRVDSNSASQGACDIRKDASGVGYTYITYEDGVAYYSTTPCN